MVLNVHVVNYTNRYRSLQDLCAMTLTTAIIVLFMAKVCIVNYDNLQIALCELARVLLVESTFFKVIQIL